MKQLCITLLLVILAPFTLLSQEIPVMWEELTSPDFKVAVTKSKGVCIIPMGVLEKHGPHMPLGTDVIVARDVAIKAAMKEYAIVFPFYFFGQIFEAKHQSGTIAYSPELLYKVLDETCHEIARNGIKKIILYSYHGGNNSFLKYFCQTQLASEKDYVVYVAEHETPDEVSKVIDSKTVHIEGGHADETEAANVMHIRPELVKIERANDESGEAMGRLPLKNLYTGIWWYADYPNHYAGNAIAAKPELGEIIINNRVNVLVEMIQTVKADSVAGSLQNEFYRRSSNPNE
ncbi:MAG: creatininase family protein [Bacteroidales bacterium]|nr:creatininase family protein [Bacteroidales bacterium]